MTKERLLKSFARKGMCVCFVSETPTSKRSVVLTDLQIKKVKDGSVLVLGRDAAIKVERDLAVRLRTSESFNRKRGNEDKRWRQIRLDGICRGTIHGSSDTRKAGVRE